MITGTGGNWLPPTELARSLIREAETALKSGRQAEVEDVIRSLLVLEARYGLTALFGPNGERWLDRFDCVISAAKEFDSGF